MNDPTPLYYVIEKEIKRRIIEGVYRTGKRMPTETELQNEFGVSRLTIREAIKRLVDLGLVQKNQGRGTYVIKPDIYHRVGFLYSPSEEILARNFQLDTKVIQLKKIKSDDYIANNLKIDVDEEVVFLERLRYADFIPAQLIKSYLPHKLVKNIESIDFTKNLLYKTLEEQYNLKLKEADEILEAINICEKDANLLDIKPGIPILLTRRTTYLSDGQIIEYNTIIYKPDVLTYHIKLKGRDQSRLLNRIIDSEKNTV